VTSSFIRYDQERQHLLPKNVAEWVEEDSLERYVSDFIDHLDNEGRLEPFYPEDRADGRSRPPFHPVMILKVLVFCSVELGYGSGIDRHIGKDEAEEDRYGGSRSPRLHQEL
jgi:hypothetical protein